MYNAVYTVAENKASFNMKCFSSFLDALHAQSVSNLTSLRRIFETDDIAILGKCSNE